MSKALSWKRLSSLSVLKLSSFPPCSQVSIYEVDKQDCRKFCTTGIDGAMTIWDFKVRFAALPVAAEQALWDPLLNVLWVRCRLCCLCVARNLITGGGAALISGGSFPDRSLDRWCSSRPVLLMGSLLSCFRTMLIPSLSSTLPWISAMIHLRWEQPKEFSIVSLALCSSSSFWMEEAKMPRWSLGIAPLPSQQTCVLAFIFNTYPLMTWHV